MVGLGVWISPASRTEKNAQKIASEKEEKKYINVVDNTETPSDKLKEF